MTFPPVVAIAIAGCFPLTKIKNKKKSLNVYTFQG
jgi:hypothetical protein